MMLRLIAGWIRHTPHKSYTALAGICVEVSLISTIAGIQRGLKADPTFARLNFTLWTTVLLLIVAAVGIVFLAIERYFSALDRTQEFGILRVLGAAGHYYCLLLLGEAVAICVPGAVAGIGVVLLIRLGIRMTFPEFLRLDIAAGWWAASLGIVMLAALIGAGIGTLKAIKDGVAQALSYEK